MMFVYIQKLQCLAVRSTCGVLWHTVVSDTTPANVRETLSNMNTPKKSQEFTVSLQKRIMMQRKLVRFLVISPQFYLTLANMPKSKMKFVIKGR